MLQKTVFKNDDFEWRDITNPSNDELLKLSEEFQLPPPAVKACLDPKHHPKFEQFEGGNFVIFRAFDEESTANGDTVNELTRKVAIFFSTKFILTISRKEQTFLKNLIDEYLINKIPLPQGIGKIQLTFLNSIISGVIKSFEAPIESAHDELEDLEMGLFEAPGSRPFKIKRAYFLKRRAWVFKRVIRLTQDVLAKIPPVTSSPKSSYFQSLKEKCDTLFFYSDELTENMNSLLNLHISLSSQKTNEASHRTGEVVRILTIFSVFLLPLNVITGIYGMNFEHMPELSFHLGYPMALAMMFALEWIIYLWFRRKGWLN